MIRTLAICELLALGAFALVVGKELVGLLVARRKGLTRNVSRVVTFSALLVLAVFYGLYELRWLRLDETAGPEALRTLPKANSGILVLGVMIALVLAYEVSALVQARIAGLTSSMSRLTALLIAVFLLLVLLGISQVRFDIYLDQLDAIYNKVLLPGGG